MKTATRRIYFDLFAGLVALAAIGLELSSSAAAYTLKTLYSFCKETDCTDGMTPAGLYQDPNGRLVGVTFEQGTNNGGTVFELIPNADKSKWSFKTLHSFCVVATCPDGSQPYDAVVEDVNGNVYGTTTNNGPAGYGTVYRLSRKGKFSVLYAFCIDIDCLGYAPFGLTYQGAASGTLYDGVSPLYGAAGGGGAHGSGTVFELDPVPGKTKFKSKVLYSFCPQSGCADGSSPAGSLLVDGGGNLFGVTGSGGTGSGVAFELTPNSRKTKWTETALYSFCQQPSCADGQLPVGALTIDTENNLFGMTMSGGGGSSVGTIYKLVPNGANSTETVLYSFCQSSCSDGYGPQAGLTLDTDGSLYGTTLFGGQFSHGTVFKLNGTSLQSLYSFCAVAGCKDGQLPATAVSVDGQGNVFGTTSAGGAHKNAGSVFELVP
jgi:uncharacterized repeat protein (TIGR03803 family)